MKQHNQRTKFLLIGVLLPLVFSGYLKPGSTQDVNPASEPQMRVTMIEAYQGVKDGNTESVQLPTDSAFITIRICLENLSNVQESLYRQDVFLDLGDNGGIYPVALGYDQAEAFSWLLPIAAPIGGKSIDHKFYFFLIQKDELVSIPAYQSVGCDNSTQFKSLALLFIVKEKNVGKPHVLNFLGARIPFRAKKFSPLSRYVIWGFGLGILIVIAATVLVLRKRKVKTQAAMLPQQNQDSPRES
jgi:hypothetical protein